MLFIININNKIIKINVFCVTFCITFVSTKRNKLTKKIKAMKTYNVVFQKNENSNDKGFSLSAQECIDYINYNNGTNNSYFSDYKNGVVQVVCNEDSEVFFETEVL